MCPIVDKIKKKFDEITNYNIEIEEDKKKIEEIANEILEYYNQDGKVEIIKIATDMGFQVFTSSFKDKLVSGFISISNENIKKYKFAKIMKIKEIVSDLNTFLKPSVFLHKETFFVSNKKRNRKVLYKMRTCEYLKIDTCPQ